MFHSSLIYGFLRSIFLFLFLLFFTMSLYGACSSEPLSYPDFEATLKKEKTTPTETSESNPTQTTEKNTATPEKTSEPTPTQEKTTPDASSESREQNTASPDVSKAEIVVELPPVREVPNQGNKEENKERPPRKPIFRASLSYAKTFGGKFSESGKSIAISSRGEIFVAGTFASTMTFKNIRVVPKGAGDAFVCKYDKDGKEEWIRAFGTTKSDSAEAIGVDLFGNVYIAGYFLDKLTIGNKTVESKGQSDVFVAKMTSSGDLVWLTSFGGNLTDKPKAIAVSKQGSVYVAGYYSGTMQVDTRQHSTKGSTDAFLVKLTAHGRVSWSRSYGGSQIDSGDSLALDSKENIYLLGGFRDSLSIGLTRHTSKGEQDIFVVKLNKEGVRKWSKSFGGPGMFRASSIVVDSQDEPIFAGTFKQRFMQLGARITSKGEADIFVMKIKSTGDVKWAKGFGGIKNEQVGDIAVNEKGRVYFGGHFQEQMKFGTKTLRSQGGSDAFLAILEENGTPLWSTSFGSTHSHVVSSVVTNKKNQLFATGHFSTEMKIGSTKLTSNGRGDVFMMMWEE